MEAKDKRIKLINEIFSGIKVHGKVLSAVHLSLLDNYILPSN